MVKHPAVRKWTYIAEIDYLVQPVLFGKMVPSNYKLIEPLGIIDFLHHCMRTTINTQAPQRLSW